MNVITGTIYDDTLISTAINDTIYGLGGDDTIGGLNGGEYLYGGEGDDYIYSSTFTPGHITRLYGDAGDDEIVGGRYADFIFGGDGNDYLHLSSGNDAIYGGLGMDVLALDAMDHGPINFTLSATGAGTVTLNSTNSSSVGTTKYYSIEGVWGGSHDDHLTGNAGANYIRGGGGNDVLSGLAGNDTLSADGGHDTLIGGQGADYFQFWGEADRWKLGADAVTIADFDPTKDSLLFRAFNFSGLHATADEVGHVAGGLHIFNIQPSEFVVQDDRYATTLSVRLIYDKVDGLLYYDGDGALQGYVSTLVADIGKNLALDASNIYLW